MPNNNDGMVEIRSSLLPGALIVGGAVIFSCQRRFSDLSKHRSK
jgi:hypothetical protein